MYGSLAVPQSIFMSAESLIVARSAAQSWQRESRWRFRCANSGKLDSRSLASPDGPPSRSRCERARRTEGEQSTKRGKSTLISAGRSAEHARRHQSVERFYLFISLLIYRERNASTLFIHRGRNICARRRSGVGIATTEKVVRLEMGK